MLLGQMSDAVLDVEGLFLAGLDGGRGSGGTFHVGSIVNDFLHIDGGEELGKWKDDPAWRRKTKKQRMNQCATYRPLRALQSESSRPTLGEQPRTLNVGSLGAEAKKKDNKLHHPIPPGSNHRMHG